MNALAFAVWPAGAVASLVALVSGQPRDIHDGEIAYERSAFCEFFVARMKGGGFVLMEDDDGWLNALSGANRVRGVRFQSGRQNIRLNDHSSLNVTVTGWVATQEHARYEFERRCDPAAPTSALRP